MNLLLFPVLVLTGGCFALGDRMGARVSSVRGQLILLLTGLLAAVPGMRFFLDDWNPCLYALWWCEVRSWPYIELTAAGVGFLAGMLCGGLPPRPAPPGAPGLVPLLAGTSAVPPPGACLGATGRKLTPNCVVRDDPGPRRGWRSAQGQTHLHPRRDAPHLQIGPCISRGRIARRIPPTIHWFSN